MVNDVHVWNRATIDHIIPRGKGGTNDPSNMVSACNRCNSRRNYEDHCGLPEGSMLGKYKETQTNAERKAQRLALIGNLGLPKPKQPSSHSTKYIALTGDEKKAIMEKTPNSSAGYSAADIHLEQRDQALREIALLRKEMKVYEAVVNTQEAELKALKSMTLWKFLKNRLAAWLLS